MVCYYFHRLSLSVLPQIGRVLTIPLHLRLLGPRITEVYHHMWLLYFFQNLCVYVCVCLHWVGGTAVNAVCLS